MLERERTVVKMDAPSVRQTNPKARSDARSD